MYNTSIHHPPTLSNSPSNSSPSWPTPPSVLFHMTPYDTDYSFGQFGSAILAVFPSTFLVHPQLPAGRIAQDLTQFKHCSAHKEGFQFQFRS